MHCNVVVGALNSVEICFAKIIMRPSATLVVSEGWLHVSETQVTKLAVAIHLAVVPPFFQVPMPHMELDVVLSYYPYLFVVVVARAYMA